MSNIDATRVMGAGGATATVQMPAGGDMLRTQMGGTTTCPVCKSTTPLMDSYCGDCGYLLASPVPDEVISLPPEEAPAAELLDELNGRRYKLKTGLNTVGRQGTDVLATEGTVSRNHATVTVSESGIIVEDLGSSNGTKVADVRLQPNQPVAAKSGDAIRFGTWSLTLSTGASAPAPAEMTMLAPPDEKTVTLSRPEAASAGEPAPVPVAKPAEAAAERAPAVAMLAKIEGICDDIPIPEGMISLGRKAGNAVVLPDPYLSSNHAEIFSEPFAVYLVDIGSTNGTYVNGRKLEPNDRQLLMDGDEIQLGQTKYRFTSAVPASPGHVDDPGAGEHVTALDESSESSEE